MKKLLYIWFAAASALLFTVTASAYIDPSAMTYIIQIIAGVAIAAGAAVSFYFRRIKRALGRLGKKKESDADDAGIADDDDDDYGFGDYSLPCEAAADTDTAPAAGAPAQGAVLTQDTVPAQKPAPAAASAVEHEPEREIPSAVSVVPDPYDETGGDALSALAAENDELRRELAREREKVSILIKALSICAGRE